MIFVEAKSFHAHHRMSIFQASHAFQQFGVFILEHLKTIWVVSHEHALALEFLQIP